MSQRGLLGIFRGRWDPEVDGAARGSALYIREVKGALLAAIRTDVDAADRGLPLHEWPPASPPKRRMLSMRLAIGVDVETGMDARSRPIGTSAPRITCAMCGGAFASEEAFAVHVDTCPGCAW